MREIHHDHALPTFERIKPALQVLRDRDILCLTPNIPVHTINMNFEWDIYKAIANWFKHGVSFSQAASALEDPSALIIQRVTAGEARFKLIGEMSETVQSSPNKVVVVIYTMRGKDTQRIISARFANADEKRTYERR
jgi:uncharacterized DUF497 family protein